MPNSTSRFPVIIIDLLQNECQNYMMVKGNTLSELDNK